jgi:hypothetical protein
VAKRLQAMLLNSQGRTGGELADVLQAPRFKVSEWLARYQAHGRLTYILFVDEQSTKL